MKLTKALLPPGYRFRELWLPELIVGSQLPSSVHGGHPLTLTGAKKGSTANGVHFDSTATSNINCGAIHNAAAKLWVSFRFKLDQDHAAASPLKFLWGKRITDNDMLRLFLDGVTGRLILLKRDAAAESFQIFAEDGAAVITSWNAGQWYHVLFSISDVNAVRFIIDNGTVVTDADVSAVCNGGDFVIGDHDDPGTASGFMGVIADVFCEEDNDLTPAEEADLYKGIPPSTVDNAYPLDEGRGSTAYDRGADSNNGTLDTDAIWDFDARKQAVLSLDGINDVAISSAGIDISGGLTFIWVGKKKNTQDTALADSTLAKLYIDANNYLKLMHANGADGLTFEAIGGGTSQIVSYAVESVIDDYMIVIATLTLAGALALGINGSIVDTATGVGAISGAAATAYLGRDSAAAEYNLNKLLMFGLVDGALSVSEDKEVSWNINNMLGLGLSI